MIDFISEPEMKIDINWNLIREDFPILNRMVNGYPLVYLDNAASSQKPVSVIESFVNYYTTFNANVHRGVHQLSQEGTDAFEASRKIVKNYINAAKESEIIFTKGTTDGINTIADTFGSAFLKKGDVILLSAMEHHSNIVPWQLTAQKSGAEIKIIPLLENGELDLSSLKSLLNENVRILALTHVSNALGTINPVKEIVRNAHEFNIPVLIDGAQAVPHMKVDVQDIDCDFYVFSGHKMYAPTGIGVLYGKEKWLEKLPPYQGGGEMIKEVTFTKTTYNDLPFKFEAGTPHIEGVIGLAEAIRYIEDIGIDLISIREKQLYDLAMTELKKVNQIRIIGTASNKAAVLSFLVGSIHPYDMGVILDKLGIAVRTGHHCTQPIMEYYKIPGTVRASFSFYNNEQDVERLLVGVHKAIQMLS